MPRFDRTKSQVKTKTTDYVTFICHPAFQEGYYEYIAGLKFQDLRNDIKSTWFYERGRMFAAATNGTHLRLMLNKKQANPIAVKYLQEFVREKAIV